MRKAVLCLEMRQGLWGPRPWRVKGTDGRHCEEGKKERAKWRTDDRRRWEKGRGGGAG